MTKLDPHSDIDRHCGEDRPWLRFFHRNETWMTGAAILGAVAAITFVMAAVLL